MSQPDRDKRGHSTSAHRTPGPPTPTQLAPLAAQHAAAQHAPTVGVRVRMALHVAQAKIEEAQRAIDVAIKIASEASAPASTGGESRG